MSIYTISKVKTHIEKDNTLGIISKMVTYQVNGDDLKNISMIGSMAHIFPDQVEIKVVNPESKEHIINSITATVNQIAVKEYSINKCPMCGKQLIHYVNTHVCVNVNCLGGDHQNRSILCLKLLTLFPDIPTKMVTDALNDFNGREDISIINIVKHFKERFEADPFNNDIVYVMDCMHNLKLDCLFAASVGGMFSNEINKAMKCYDHSLKAAMEDVDTVFENLYHACDERLRIAMTLIIRVNKELLDLILL
jgi:predicted RNA-binding Zn-ribbon protein involved in translation (DUF1610 family)